MRPDNLAVIYVALGEYNAAFRWLTLSLSDVPFYWPSANSNSGASLASPASFLNRGLTGDEGNLSVAAHMASGAEAEPLHALTCFVLLCSAERSSGSYPQGVGFDSRRSHPPLTQSEPAAVNSAIESEDEDG
jgi:hypothetical protein